MLEQMRLELKKAGHDVHFVTINKGDAADYLTALSDRSSFAILQDSAAINAWGLLGGGKDDFLVLRADGTVNDYLPFGGPRSTALPTRDGYETLLQAIYAAEAAGKP